MQEPNFDIARSRANAALAISRMRRRWFYWSLGAFALLVAAWHALLPNDGEWWLRPLVLWGLIASAVFVVGLGISLLMSASRGVREVLKGTSRVLFALAPLLTLAGNGSVKVCKGGCEWIKLSETPLLFWGAALLIQLGWLVLVWPLIRRRS